MSLQYLPIEVLEMVVSAVLPPPQAGEWLRSKHVDRVKSLRLVNRRFNEITIRTVLGQADFAVDHFILRFLAVETLALIIRKKALVQGRTTGVLFTLISKVRTALRSIIVENGRLKWDMETYVAAFIDVTLQFLGKVDAIQHAAAQNLPEEAIFFGSKLGDFDLVMIAAVWQRDAELVSLLIRNGQLGPQSGRDSRIYTVAQYLASARGDIDMLRLVRHHGNPCVNATCGYLGNAIRAAVWSGNLDVVNCLISWGADVNAFGIKSGRPLHLAIYYGNLDVVRALLEAGADITISDGDQDGFYVAATAPSAEARANAVPIMELLLEYSTEGDDGMLAEKAGAICGAAREGNVDVVRFLLEGTLNPNIRSKQNRVIGYANEGGSVEVMKLLLEYGPQEPYIERQWLLGAALERGHTDLAKFHLDQTTDEELLLDGGYHAFYEAIFRGNPEILKILLERGVPVEPSATQRILERLAQHPSYPCVPGDAQVIDLLIENSLKPNSFLQSMALKASGSPVVESPVERLRDVVSPERCRMPTLIYEKEVHTAMVKLDAGAELTWLEVDCLLSEAVKLRDVGTVKRLMDRYPDPELERQRPLRTDKGVLDVVAILMIKHTGRQSKSQRHAAQAFLESFGQTVVEIARLLGKCRVGPQRREAIPFEKICHALETDNMALLDFFLPYYGHHIAEDLPENLIFSSNFWMKKKILDRWNGPTSNLAIQALLESELNMAICGHDIATAELLLSKGFQTRMNGMALSRRDPRSRRRDLSKLLRDEEFMDVGRASVQPEYADASETMMRLVLSQSWWRMKLTRYEYMVKEMHQYSLGSWKLQLLADLGLDIAGFPTAHGDSTTEIAVDFGYDEEIKRFLLEKARFCFLHETFAGFKWDPMLLYAIRDM